jgi:hypothetical protein
MPQASGLGDVRREHRGDTKVDIPPPPAEPEKRTCYTKAITCGICMLLVGAGTGVGLWAAFN